MSGWLSLTIGAAAAVGAAVGCGVGELLDRLIVRDGERWLAAPLDRPNRREDA